MIAAAFAIEDGPDETGLTLALPLVDADTAAPRPQAVTEAAEADEPVVMYVSAVGERARAAPRPRPRP